MDANDVGADLKEVLIPAERLQARIAELAAQVDADYAGRELLLVGVLKGAVMVMADLARAMHLPAQMDWMAVSSYGSGTRSSGVVRILKDLDTDITGKDVLVVEDIVDSGLTLSWLVGNLRSRGPASVQVCVMLRKPAAARMDVDVAYTGFDIEDEFVIGYGLDYAEKYRNLPFIGTLAPHVYKGAEPSPRPRRAAAPPGGTGSAIRSVEVCEGSLESRRLCPSAGGAGRGVPSGIPGGAAGNDSAAGYDKKAGHAHSSTGPFRRRWDMKLVRRNPRETGGAVHRWI